MLYTVSIRPSDSSEMLKDRYNARMARMERERKIRSYMRKLNKSDGTIAERRIKAEAYVDRVGA